MNETKPWSEMGDDQYYRFLAVKHHPNHSIWPSVKAKAIKILWVFGSAPFTNPYFPVLLFLSNWRKLSLSWRGFSFQSLTIGNLRLRALEPRKSHGKIRDNEQFQGGTSWSIPGTWSAKLKSFGVKPAENHSDQLGNLKQAFTFPFEPGSVIGDLRSSSE